MKFIDKYTNQVIEVDDIDAHWYNGHEGYDVYEETKETLETESGQPQEEVLKRKPGRPRKE